MGLDITVLALDWERLGGTPERELEALLYEAACPDSEPWPDVPERGWVFPASPEVPWAGRYEFHGTTGSYKPHFFAADAWDSARATADPALRESLDAFLLPLIWEGPEEPPEPQPLPGFPHPLLACPPGLVRATAAHWSRARPLLPALRSAYAPDRDWFPGFDAFHALIGEWGTVVEETARRGWGLLGLPI
ncbi:hypothetical protein ABZX85_43295 [Streptomyces sp. NPDC004539]|uniref:hypothetical protein n=1 Tax=Streptomyces sp. NPDC004539 TaxID=3154280 RepID=UPI0033B286FB